MKYNIDNFEIKIQQQEQQMQSLEDKFSKGICANSYVDSIKYQILEENDNHVRATNGFASFDGKKINISFRYNADIVDVVRQLAGRKYNPETKTIDINSIYVKMSDVDKRQFREVIDTLIHEGRHAYQDYNVNVCEVHPRHSEVISWAETMEGGKWGYHGDVSTKLGQRLYEQQAIEIDARNFAADVLDKFEQKQISMAKKH